MLGWIANIFGARKPGTRQGAARAASSARLRYDAAQTTPDNRRHFLGADALSANASNSPEVRSRLRERSRYEVANNSYAKGIVLTLANDVIGTGPRLQCLTTDPDTNSFIEYEFGRWAEAVDLAGKLRTMKQSHEVDGEAFAVFVDNPGLPTRVKLDLSLVECDRVTSRKWSHDPLDIDGVHLDSMGRPREYSVLDTHPGDLRPGYDMTPKRIPAESVLHWFRVDRPGQARGIPPLTPALPLFAYLRRYTLATVAAAETAANYAAVLYTESPPGGEADEYENVPPEMEIERNTMPTLPAGWKLGQLKPEQPTTTYSAFKNEILGEIARCLNMPFNVAAGNSSGYNYASGRLDFQTYFKSIRVEQSDIEVRILQRIFEEWLDEASLIQNYIPADMMVGVDDYLPCAWFWDGTEHVDPAKEAAAQATRIANRTTTLAYEYAKQGKDWEAEVRQLARERDLLEDLGLLPEQAMPTVAVDPSYDPSYDPTDDMADDEEDDL